MHYMESIIEGDILGYCNEHNFLPSLSILNFLISSFNRLIQDTICTADSYIC